ncbi:MAG: hypothetical protein ABEK12_01515, partial [Candidatus Nanohaloarchaea archaeon]
INRSEHVYRPFLVIAGREGVSVGNQTTNKTAPANVTEPGEKGEEVPQDVTDPGEEGPPKEGDAPTPGQTPTPRPQPQPVPAASIEVEDINATYAGARMQYIPIRLNIS